jgi:multicomponent Na+:H+ antiporter subunit D
VRLFLPVVVPLATAALGFLLWRWPRWQRRLGVVGAAGLLASGLWLLDAVRREGIQTAQAGGWPAPFGITFVADLFSALLVVLAGFVGLAATVYSLVGIDHRREAFGFHPLLHALLMGVCGAFLTGDVFNLYVWFELLMIASFVLLTLGGERGQTEGAFKYVTLNLIASFLFLCAVGILYGKTGMLNMAQLGRDAHRLVPPGLLTTTAVLFLVAFGIKAAVFPLFFWLPASYHTPPAVVSAVFAGLLTTIGVYALVRLFTLLFVHDTGYTHGLLLAVAGATMLVGALGAVAQRELRRLLSFAVVGSGGYMLLGLGLLTPVGLAGTVFYALQDGVVKACLFLAAGLVERLGGTGELKGLAGVYRAHPLIAWLVLVPAFSLASVPPLGGFFAKLVLVQAGLAAGQGVLVAVVLLSGLLTLLAVTRVWLAFWAPASGEPACNRAPRLAVLPVVVLAGLAVAAGLAAGPLFALAGAAGEQLLDRSQYVRAVLGAGA